MNANHFYHVNCRGIALVTVLWVVVLLSLMAAAISVSSRSTGQLTSNLYYASQGRYASVAGIQWAYWGLQIPADQVPWLADGSVYEMPLADMLVRVSVFDENGKIDLNEATEEMLRPLLISAEVEDERIDSLVDAILDWRDDDDLKRLNGAEDDDYLQAALGWQAKDAPFESILELRQVLGMDEQVFRAIRNSLTIYSGKRKINPLVAPKLVLMAFSDMDELQAEQFIEERRELHRSGEQPSSDQFTSSFFSTSMVGVNYTIHTQAVTNPQFRSGMMAVVRRQGKQGRTTFKKLDIQPAQEGIFSDIEL